MRKASVAAALLSWSIACTAHAALIGVSWAPDSNPDGLGSGTLGALGVSLVSTNGNVNGGDTFSASWHTRTGTNDVPGIAALAGANRNAIDGVGANTPGFATITFTGGTVTNPILLFDFTEAGELFDFADGLTLSILDQSPAGSVVIGPNNVVQVNAPAANGANDSFALQLMGTFTSIHFDTLLRGISAESVGFTIAVEETDINRPVRAPLPATGALLLLGLAALGFVKGRAGSKPA